MRLVLLDSWAFLSSMLATIKLDTQCRSHDLLTCFRLYFEATNQGPTEATEAGVRA